MHINVSCHDTMHHISYNLKIKSFLSGKKLNYSSHQLPRNLIFSNVTVEN